MPSLSYSATSPSDKAVGMVTVASTSNVTDVIDESGQQTSLLFSPKMVRTSRGDMNETSKRGAKRKGRS
jgi:hypothetical protein